MKQTFGDRMASLFNIRPGEGWLVSLLLAHSFSIGWARIFARTAAFTLFLAEFDAQSLPYTYIGVSIIVTLISFAYLKMGERLSFSNLLIVTLSFLLITLIALRVGLGLSGAGWLVFALPIWYEVLWTLTNLEFWNLAGRLFNVRQGKRLFGLIGSGEQVAIIIGGLLVPVLVGLIDISNLLLTAAVAIAAAVGLLFYITHSFADHLSAPVEKAAAKGQESGANLLRNRYILLIYGLFGLGMVGFFFIDNIFYFQAEVQYPSQNQLASFIGVFFGVLGLITLFSKALLTSPIMRHYGMRVGLLVTPVILAISGTFTAVAGAAFGAVVFFFWLVAMTKLLSVVFVESVDVSALNVLYQPLPATLRLRVQTAVEGLAYPVSIGLAGLVLSLLTTFFAFGAIQLVYVLLFILTVWIVLAIHLGRGYQMMLAQALAKRRLDARSVMVVDGSSIAVLQQTLHSPNAGAAIYALDTLKAMEHESLPAALEGLLAHPALEVRQHALRCIEELGLTSAQTAVRQRVSQEPSARVRGTALRTLAALGEAESLETVSAYLEDGDPHVRRGVMVGLLRSGGIEGVLMAGHKLLQMSGSPHATERALAAQVLGEVGVCHFCQPLMPLLADQDPQVRRAALLAAGELKSPRLWPLTIEGLGWSQVRGAATAALVAGGQSAVPELKAAFAKHSQNREILIRLAIVCGRIGGDEVTALLKDRIDFPDEGVRTQVLRSLSRCGYQAQNEAEVGLIQRQIQAEMAQAAWTLAALVDVADEESVSLLREALTAKLGQGRTRLLFLLSFIYEAETILRARDNLSHPSAEKRAYALEVIEVLIEKELKRLIIPLLRDLPPSQRLQELSAYFPQRELGGRQRLREIITGPDEVSNAWIQACALFAVGRLSASELSQTVVATLCAPDPLVRETAVWTLSCLNAALLSRYAGQLQRDLSPQVIRAIQHLETARDGDKTMLSTIEKVIILKTVGIFAETPDDILAEMATLLEEVELMVGETIFEKGDLGDCMYIIAEGEVRVHDGERTLNHLAQGDVFGEMALLDPEPRVASVTAIEDTHLLRLDQEPFYELMNDRIEVVRGIIHVLSRHLRARVRDLNELEARLKSLGATGTNRQIEGDEQRPEKGGV
jgi:AAA family ATP:ADP antiporter